MTGTITSGRGIQRWLDTVGGSSRGEGQEVLVGCRGVAGAEQMRVGIDGVEARGLRGYEKRSRCCVEEGHTAPRHVSSL
jgi:hypothetical protein